MIVTPIDTLIGTVLWLRIGRIRRILVIYTLIWTAPWLILDTVSGLWVIGRICRIRRILVIGIIFHGEDDGHEVVFKLRQIRLGLALHVLQHLPLHPLSLRCARRRIR